LIDRKKGLLLTHVETKYTIFIYSITKKDLKNLNQIIVKHLKYHLFEDKFTMKQMTYLLSISENFAYFSQTNRGVTATMNSMAAIIKSQNSIDDKLITKKLNNMLFTINEQYQFPLEVMKEYIEESVLIREL